MPIHLYSSSPRSLQRHFPPDMFYLVHSVRLWPPARSVSPPRSVSWKGEKPNAKRWEGRKEVSQLEGHAVEVANPISTERSEDCCCPTAVWLRARVLLTAGLMKTA